MSTQPLELWHAQGGDGKLRAYGRDPLPPYTPPAARFPGDPGPGKMYYGLALNLVEETPEAFVSRTGAKLGMYRRYFQGTGGVPGLAALCTQDILADRIPWVSFKTPQWVAGAGNGWLETANGTNDAWLISMRDAIATVPGPVMWTIHHEPRKDGPAADFVAMHEHAAPIMQQAPNLCHTTILNGYAFDPHGDPDPKIWYTPSVNLIGYDQYNGWWAYDHITVGVNGASVVYQVWKSLADWIVPAKVIQSWGKPTAIAEWGVHHPWLEPGKDVQFMVDAYNAALAAGCASLCWFNTDLNTPMGHFLMHEYLKPELPTPDYTTNYPDLSRQDQFVSDSHRKESASVSKALT